MRGELRRLVEELLLSGRVSQRGYFRSEAARWLASEHGDGKHDYWHREILN
jgi:hypothetical protein